MSAESPIELIDDDEEDDEEEKTTNDSAVQTFLEFSGSNDRDFAVKMLRESNNDLQLALTAAFQSNQPAPVAQQQPQIEIVDENPKLVAKKPTSLIGDRADHATARSTSAEAIEEDEDPLRSIKWYNCMAKSPELFVDPDFPPNQSSLDGRKQQTAKEDQVTNCICGMPATAKTVQSDGPNYGRFYLCCAKARQRGAHRQQQCKYFQWDDNNGSKGAGYSTRYSLMAWEFFGKQHVLVNRKTGFAPDAVRQGAVGNCWFLSALAVVAEKPYLVRQLLPHRELNDKGCYQVNLCLDGKWTPIILDSHLPVVFGGRIVDPLRGGTASSTDSSSTVHPAFCAVPNGQLWAALIEKAYAKAHGSYEQLSGGFIQEGFQDMTGAPTETLIFDGNIWDFDELWARLLSFHEAGFLMGVATSRGGDGLVGGHAYSILDVVELNDMLVGEQQSMKDFLQGSPVKKKQRTTVRLVRIRNPWGKKEWKGEWSASSDQWTKALRKRLGEKSYAKGDGTFFMSYHDMLQRFHHMDVAKCRRGWKQSSCDGRFLAGSRDPLKSSDRYFSLEVQEKTFAFISIIQPKKRANTKSQYWYCDPSLIVLKRKSPEGGWECEKAVASGMVRTSVLEVFLDPAYEYCVVPFSFKTERNSPFRISSYSAKPVGISHLDIDRIEQAVPLEHLHRHLLKDESKLQYVVASQAVLLCVNGYRCMYFVIVNSSQELVLSLRICVKLQKGLILSHGASGDIFDVPPKSQRIALVVASDGTLSSAVSLSFTYASDTVNSKVSKAFPSGRSCSFGGPVQLTMAGELLASAVEPLSNRNKGGDTIETYQWLAQIGAQPQK